jgi:hypothetical protein
VHIAFVAEKTAAVCETLELLAITIACLERSRLGYSLAHSCVTCHLLEVKYIY